MKAIFGLEKNENQHHCFANYTANPKCLTVR